MLMNLETPKMTFAQLSKIRRHSVRPNSKIQCPSVVSRPQSIKKTKNVKFERPKDAYELMKGLEQMIMDSGALLND